MRTGWFALVALGVQILAALAQWKWSVISDTVFYPLLTVTLVITLISLVVGILEWVLGPNTVAGWYAGLPYHPRSPLVLRVPWKRTEPKGNWHNRLICQFQSVDYGMIGSVTPPTTRLTIDMTNMLLQPVEIMGVPASILDVDRVVNLSGLVFAYNGPIRIDPERTYTFEFEKRIGNEGYLHLVEKANEGRPAEWNLLMTWTVKIDGSYFDITKRMNYREVVPASVIKK